MKTIKVEIAKNKKDSIGYISDALKRIHETDEHGYPREEVERLLKIEKELKESFEPLQKQFEKINSTIEKGIKAFLETARLIAEPTFEALLRVSEFGWYLSPEVIRDYPISQLADLLQQEDLSGLESSILKDSSRLMNSTINKAKQTFPARNKVLTEIQNCFDNELYSATVNLAYSQADGICNEIWGFGFFDKTGKPDFKLKTHVEFEKFNEGLASLISKQLSIKENEVTMYSESFKEQFPNKVSTSFNRHLILHGHSVGYGNKKNAVRAVLLIDFLMYFKDEKEKNSL